LPNDLEAILRRFPRVVCAELNTGQLAGILRGRFLIDIEPITKIQGQPFKESELLHALRVRLEAN
jgi:2-oxoglutarate ferredoxin oxidoreductase subunit alpha